MRACLCACACVCAVVCNSFITEVSDLVSGVYLVYKVHLTLINATYFQNYLTRGGAQSSSTQKPAVSVIFLHSKQQKTFQGILGTQDLTSIGSKTSLGPSMDPTGSLNWTLWFLRKFQAVHTNSIFFIL